MHCGYRYRFYPGAEQEVLLLRTLGCARYVYNRALEERQDAWKSGRSLGYKETSALLTKWKREPETAWLKEVSCVPVQQSLRHLDAAFGKFFRKEARYPRFRRKQDPQGIEFTTSGFHPRPRCLDRPDEDEAQHSLVA